MDDVHPWMYIIIYIIFIVIEAFFFGFGSAIQNINTTDLEKEMEAGSRKAGNVLRIINRPRRFINTVQSLSNLTGYITGGFFIIGFIPLASDIASKNYADTAIHSVLCIISYLVAVILMVSFGMVIPKCLAMRKPEKWAYACLSIVRFFMTLFSPVIFAVHGLSYVVLRIFGIDMNKQEDSVTEEDIMSMVNEGHEQGILESSEAEMITNIFELNDKHASDVMTHRKHITAIEGQTLLKDAVGFMLNSGNNSRYPVYIKDIDNIRGILNMKDALISMYLEKNEDKAVDNIKGLLREANFIPETRNLDSLFKEMQSKKMHMVIVVDEYGQTSGIVTMEDIIEEIVGNIMDEYDVDEKLITPLGDKSFIMKGLTPLDEAAKALDMEFDEEEYNNFDTLNGFLISKLDRIPSDGEKFEVNSHGVNFKVLFVKDKMIKSVRARKIEGENNSGEKDDDRVYSDKEKEKLTQEKG